VRQVARVGAGLSFPRSVISRRIAAAPLTTAMPSATSAAVRNVMPVERASGSWNRGLAGSA